MFTDAISTCQVSGSHYEPCWAPVDHVGVSPGDLTPPLPCALHLPLPLSIYLLFVSLWRELLAVPSGWDGLEYVEMRTR